MATLRLCRRCNTEKPPEQFYVGTSNTWCRACNSARARERYLERNSGTKPAAVETPSAVRPSHSDHDAEMLAHGEAIVRQCPRAYHALDVITSGWWAMNRGQG